MPDDGAGMQLTVLGRDRVGATTAGSPTSTPTPTTCRSCWVRGNMIASLDGGATDDGKAGGLAGPGDRAVFALMREARRRHPRRRGHRPHRELLRRPAARRRSGRPGSAAARPRCRRSPSSPDPATSTRRPAVHPHRGAAADPDLRASGRRHPPPARSGGRGHRRVRAGPGPRRLGDGPRRSWPSAGCSACSPRAARCSSAR